MSIEIRARGKFLLIEAIKPDAGAIAIPDPSPEAIRAHQRGVELYFVRGVGEGRMASDGSITKSEYKIGDEVVLAPDTQITELPALLFGYNGKCMCLVDVTCVMANIDGRDGIKAAGYIEPSKLLVPNKKLVHA